MIYICNQFVEENGILTMLSLVYHRYIITSSGIIETVRRKKKNKIINEYFKHTGKEWRTWTGDGNMLLVIYLYIYAQRKCENACRTSKKKTRKMWEGAKQEYSKRTNGEFSCETWTKKKQEIEEKKRRKRKWEKPKNIARAQRGRGPDMMF